MLPLVNHFSIWLENFLQHRETSRWNGNRTANLRIIINTLRPRQIGRHFADDTFKRIFLNENVRISIKISLKYVPKGPINNNPALIQIMAWCRSGDKPLSEQWCLVYCVTRPQWVKKGINAELKLFTYSIRVHSVPGKSPNKLNVIMAWCCVEKGVVNIRMRTPKHLCNQRFYWIFMSQDLLKDFHTKVRLKDFLVWWLS